MCEEKESSEMLRIGGGFWEGGLDTVEKGVPHISPEEEEIEEEEWEKEVIGTLESLKHVKVEDGCVCAALFHISLIRSLRPGHLPIMRSMFHSCTSFLTRSGRCSRCLLADSRLGHTSR
jgi:nuclear pore complex protein Nup107